MTALLLVRRRFGQLVRYGLVSGVATAVSLTILTLLTMSGAMGAARANVVATLAGMVPSFELNRRYVWGGSGRPSVRRQVVPFVLMSLCGLLLSTLAVAAAAHWATVAHLSDARTAGVVVAANVAAFGSVWVAQFFVLDRLLFRAR